MDIIAPSKPAQDKKDLPNSLRTLVITDQYPNSLHPEWAPFNRQQIDALAAMCRIGVVVPVSWNILLGSGRLRLPPRQAPYPVSWPVFWYLPRMKRSWHGAAFFYSAWPALKSMASRIKPQVLLSTWLYPAGWAGMLAARKLGIPFVIKLHGSDLMILRQDPQRLPYLKQILAQANGVVAVSRQLGQEAATLGAQDQRVHLVPNGLNQGIFTPKDRDQSRVSIGLDYEGQLVVFVGRLVAVKGLDTALKAMSRLKGVKLLVVGEGPMRAELQALAQRLQIEDRVIWAGGQPHSRVPLFISAADALVLPSLSEGDPNAVLEALGCGRPVVASAVGGVPDIVKDRMQGYVFEPGDAEGMAECLRKTLGRKWDPALLQKAVRSRSWQNSAAGLLAVLEEVAAEGKQR